MFKGMTGVFTFQPTNIVTYTKEGEEKKFFSEFKIQNTENVMIQSSKDGIITW